MQNAEFRIEKSHCHHSSFFVLLMKHHYRTIAGNLEFFLGAYFIDFGLLGLLFFWRRFENRDVMRVNCSGAFRNCLRSGVPFRE